MVVSISVNFERASIGERLLRDDPRKIRSRQQTVCPIVVDPSVSVSPLSATLTERNVANTLQITNEFRKILIVRLI